MRIFDIAIVSVAAGIAVPPASAQVIYRLTPIGAHPSASGLNNAGEVVGTDTAPGSVSKGYLWRRGVTTDLSALGIVHAGGINDKGQVACTLQTGRACIYFSGMVQDLDPTGIGSYATAINNKGVVAGAYTYDLAKSRFTAAIFTDGKIESLGVPGDLNGNSGAQAINDAGQVVGTGGGGIQRSNGFLYSNGVVTVMGDFGGEFSDAYAINREGWVVGFGTAPLGDSHGYVYRNGKLVDLLQYGAGSANGVNDEGVTVGEGTRCTDICVTYPFVYKRGVFDDLNARLDPATGAGWIRQSAIAINNRGQILGYGTNPNGDTRAFLLTPERNQ